MDNTTEAFGWVASVLSITFFTSPIIMYIKVIKNIINYVDSPFIIIYTNLLNCVVWEIYGIRVEYPQVIVTNCFGCLASILCFGIYFYYYLKDVGIEGLKKLVLTISIPLILIFVIVFVINYDVITGFVANFFGVVAFSSPLVILYRVYIGSSYSLIPIHTAIASLIATSCWITYGQANNNFFIILQNVIGLVIAILQIFVYNFYRRKEKKLKKLKKFNISDISESTAIGERTGEVEVKETEY